MEISAYNGAKSLRCFKVNQLKGKCTVINSTGAHAVAEIVAGHALLSRKLSVRWALGYLHTVTYSILPVALWGGYECFLHL